MLSSLISPATMALNELIKSRDSAHRPIDSADGMSSVSEIAAGVDVAVGGTDVAVGGTGVLVGSGCGVGVFCGASVGDGCVVGLGVGGWGVGVDVAVGGTGVSVGGTGVSVGWGCIVGGAVGVGVGVGSGDEHPIIPMAKLTAIREIGIIFLMSGCFRFVDMFICVFLRFT